MAYLNIYRHVCFAVLSISGTPGTIRSIVWGGVKLDFVCSKVSPSQNRNDLRSKRSPKIGGTGQTRGEQVRVREPRLHRDDRRQRSFQGSGQGDTGRTHASRSSGTIRMRRAKAFRSRRPSRGQSAPGDVDRGPIQGHQTFRQRRDTKKAKAAFPATVDKGTIGLKAAMADTPYA
jgi:hypothetical protein